PGEGGDRGPAVGTRPVAAVYRGLTASVVGRPTMGRALHGRALRDQAGLQASSPAASSCDRRASLSPTVKSTESPVNTGGVLPAMRETLTVCPRGRSTRAVPSSNTVTRVSASQA